MMLPFRFYCYISLIFNLQIWNNFDSSTALSILDCVTFADVPGGAWTLVPVGTVLIYSHTDVTQPVQLSLPKYGQRLVQIQKGKKEKRKGARPCCCYSILRLSQRPHAASCPSPSLPHTPARVSVHSSPAARLTQPERPWRPSRRKCRCWSWIRRTL